MNVASLLILLLVLSAAAAALHSLRRRKKRAPSACDGCAFRDGCPHCGAGKR